MPNDSARVQTPPLNAGEPVVIAPTHRERRGVANLVIIASLKASEGQLYRYPVTIRLIK
ncbi:MAG: DUF4870 domain-containing protein [Chthoniobacterales bacterium]|nr:DUF4870 domain-containing protein [Chthoniobacterales bacterium]